jgi:hypothetical protein
MGGAVWQEGPMGRAGRAIRARWTGVLLLAVASFSLSGPALAIEFWDERVQIHGFYETRMSFGWEDFSRGNSIDMYGWLHVLNVETEVEIAPDGWGPFDMIAAFARVEVKYDCVWNHACGVFPSVDAFGNDPGNLPERVQTGNRTGIAGSQITFDHRPFWFADRSRLNGGLFAEVEPGQRASKSFVFGSTNVGLYGASAGPDTQLGRLQDVRNERGVNALFYDGNWTDPTTRLPGDDDAGNYLFNRTSHCRVGNWTQKAANRSGFGNRELIWEIDDCKIQPTGFTRRVANPFRDETYGTDPTFGGDVNPVLLAFNLDPTSAGFNQPLDPNGNGIPDATALPLRPGAERGINENAKKWESQGIFVPNLRTRRELKASNFDDFDQNFTLNELQWNRGASQETWKELRELYLEFEAFESQLWVRGGKQTIVWGKTELFRNQDQWNPVDIAIGPLASLEEARIALWALRGIWSFYEVGPLEDVRLELVGLFDKFEPTDIGRCGEPFVPRLACNKSYGLWVHGENGTGVAGEMRPPDPWNDSEGWEVGARVEFRYDRFSFALTDYYGYQDTPYVSVLFNYDRNVDPVSGRPRHTNTTGPCPTGAEPACLVPNHAPLQQGESGDVVEIHSINQSLFAWICAGTVGVAPTVDSAACAFTLFNTNNDFGLGVGGAQVFSSVVSGSAGAGAPRYQAFIGDFPPPASGITVQTQLLAAFGPGGTNTLFPYPAAAGVAGSPLVPLVNDGANDNDEGNVAFQGLDGFLSQQQEALFGCGEFYFTDCDGLVAPGPDGVLGTSDDTQLGGIDLANADASVLLQSFPWFEGTKFNPYWDTADASLPQPGTVDAAFNDGPGGGVDAPDSKPGEIETGPAGSRFENGTSYILPGAHYDPAAFAGVLANAAANGISVDQWVLDNLAGYDVAVDGSTGCATAAGCRAHPFTGQLWSSEMAIASWNLLMLTVALGATDNAQSLATLDRTQPLALGRCSFRQPQYCAFVSGLAAQARNTRNDVRAGGNGRFGRRNFVWASVGDVALKYEKRNIVGFSMDFAEDTTKSSWGVEFTYIDDTFAADNGSMSGLTDLDEYNLTLSVDRPTFINFLNANRTFFINSQLFVSHLQGYSKDVLRDGPWTALILLNANTGYFQDRFLVGTAAVYDFTSQSMAFLPSVQYRFTENFSVTIGAAVLAGKWKGGRDVGVNQFSATSDTNLNDTIYVENGISPARDLDNFFLRLRYTF